MPITMLQKGKTDKKPGKGKRRKAKTRDKTMGINVSTAMGFENRDFLRSTAKQILQKSGADEEKAEAIIKNNLNYYERPEVKIYNASAQITLNNSLKETLKYLRTHAKDKRKEHILGELWKRFNEFDSSAENELIDFEVNYNLKNIFAA